MDQLTVITIGKASSAGAVVEMPPLSAGEATEVRDDVQLYPQVRRLRRMESLNLVAHVGIPPRAPQH